MVGRHSARQAINASFPTPRLPLYHPRPTPTLLPAINAVHMPRLKSPTILLPSPPPHVELPPAGCCSPAIADLTLASQPPLPVACKPRAVAPRIIATCRLPLYIYIQARAAHTQEEQWLLDWRVRDPASGPREPAARRSERASDGVLLLPGGPAAEGAEQQAGGGDLLALRRVR